MNTSTCICAVVVTYNPDTATLKQLLGACEPQVAHLRIIDNGSHPDVTVWLQEQVRGNVSCLLLGRNLGVAGAHNRGIAWAKDHDFSHVLLMDQDSIPAPDMVEKLSFALAHLSQRGVRVAAVGPQQVDSYTGTVSPFTRFGTLKLKKISCSAGITGEVLETDFLITSGSLIPVRALQDIGPMEAGFFVDHVDTEWVLRAKHRGYKLFGVCDAVMRHSLGTGTLRFWFLRWRNVALHSPERHYYVFRNSLLLFKRPHAPWQWILNDTVRLIDITVFFTMFAPCRIQRIRMIARGILDGLRGAEGPLRH